MINTEQQDNFKMMLGESTYNLRKCVILPMLDSIIELQQKVEELETKVKDLTYKTDYPNMCYD